VKDAWELTQTLVDTARELFQATGIPARHADLAFVRWLLGTTLFSWHDVACYPIGVALLDRAFLRTPRPEE
jgi:hypothetical protein